MGETKKLFGKGIYGSKDVPIKLLDTMIVGVILLVILLVFWFASHGGFTVSFDSHGGSEVENITADYGDYITQPENPTRPGYVFAQWITSLDESLSEVWDFTNDMVEDSMVLYAVWEPAEIKVIFDLDGGSYQGVSQQLSQTVVYGETYGTLPVVTKEDATFIGWMYSGSIIEEDTVVTMTGEHVLTACWE
ncbi:MAG: InlB B-repeat-containing protein [Lachnospiraceae bacterium]